MSRYSSMRSNGGLGGERRAADRDLALPGLGAQPLDLLRHAGGQAGIALGQRAGEHDLEAASPAHSELCLARRWILDRPSPSTASSRTAVVPSDGPRPPDLVDPARKTSLSGAVQSKRRPPDDPASHRVSRSSNRSRCATEFLLADAFDSTTRRGVENRFAILGVGTCKVWSVIRGRLPMQAAPRRTSALGLAAIMAMLLIVTADNRGGQASAQAAAPADAHADGQHLARLISTSPRPDARARSPVRRRRRDRHVPNGLDMRYAAASSARRIPADPAASVQRARGSASRPLEGGEWQQVDAQQRDHRGLRHHRPERPGGLRLEPADDPPRSWRHRAGRGPGPAP